jgi:hypothetical protein
VPARIAGLECPNRKLPIPGKTLKDQMNLEKQRAKAQRLCAESGIVVLPYGNAWWLLGQGINRVVGELAGLSASDFHRYQAIQR